MAWTKRSRCPPDNHRLQLTGDARDGSLSRRGAAPPRAAANRAFFVIPPVAPHAGHSAQQTKSNCPLALIAPRKKDLAATQPGEGPGRREVGREVALLRISTNLPSRARPASSDAEVACSKSKTAPARRLVACDCLHQDKRDAAAGVTDEILNPRITRIIANRPGERDA